MPAVVRGGRRQAPAQGKAANKAAPKPAARTAAKPRGKRSVSGGKYKIIGAIPMPTELTAWVAVLVVTGLLAAVLMTGGRARIVGGYITHFADERIAALGLNVQNVRLVGVSPDAAPDIKKAIPFHRGDPLALMDLNAVQTAVENVGWVKSATVRRQFPGVLVITVVERPRLAVWQYRQKDVVIDDQGHIIPEADARKFLGLPLIIGEGANEQASDILQLMTQRPDLLQRTAALVRVDTRRWDILLKNNTVIKLPALNQDQALSRLDTLIAQQRVLDQGFAEIDLLDPDALQVVPMDPHAASKTPPTVTTTAAPAPIA